MSTEVTFDVLFRDLFNAQSRFGSISEIKIPHPVDIYEHSDGLVFEIACTGLSRDEVDIEIELDVLKVNYNKPQQHDGIEEARTYQCRGVARRSFNLAYKISPKYTLSESVAVMENGLLIVTIPFADEAKPKKLQIK
jgi:HSP20 family protein